MSNKVPQIRFNGYSDAWEDRKLKDVTERVRSNDGRMDLPTLTMSASSGWLDQKDRFSGDISGKEKKNYTLLKKGELSYNHGNSKLAKYGVVFSLTNYEEALVPRVYHSFKALENTSADFIEYMFSTKLPDRELGKLVSSGARMDGLLNINYDDFMNIHISIPNYEEQILISAFFRKLDETIDLHQRKLDLLKEQKKGYLQKMFPKNGAKVPELRFAGFADDWEERKLSDIADRFDNLRVPITASDRKSGDTPYYGANGIQDYVEGFTHDGEFILVAEDGANDLKNYPVQYVNGKVWVNNHAHVLQGKKTITDNKFLMNSIKNFNIEPFLVGGGRAKLNADVMMKLNVLLPTFEEQEKIGSFFKQLDDTITLHQRKLDLLKEQKKGLLQKMFV